MPQVKSNRSEFGQKQISVQSTNFNYLALIVAFLGELNLLNEMAGTHLTLMRAVKESCHVSVQCSHPAVRGLWGDLHASLSSAS